MYIIISNYIEYKMYTFENKYPNTSYGQLYK